MNTQEQFSSLPWPQRVAQIIDRFASGNQARFGREVGISPQAVNSLLRGSVPQGARLEAIALAYPHLSTRFLLTGIGPLVIDTQPNGAYNRGALAALTDLERALQETRARYGAAGSQERSD